MCLLTYVQQTRKLLHEANKGQTVEGRREGKEGRRAKSHPDSEPFVLGWGNKKKNPFKGSIFLEGEQIESI